MRRANSDPDIIRTEGHRRYRVAPRGERPQSYVVLVHLTGGEGGAFASQLPVEVVPVRLLSEKGFELRDPLG
jgi:hypothetical protein